MTALILMKLGIRMGYYSILRAVFPFALIVYATTSLQEGSVWEENMIRRSLNIKSPGVTIINARCLRCRSSMAPEDTPEL